MTEEKQPLVDDLELGNLTKENETGSSNMGRWSEGLSDPGAPKHVTSQKAKEKQQLMENLSEFEITKLSEFEPPKEMIWKLHVINENETGSSNMGRWSEGVLDPGLWPSWVNKEYCCIYRVPNRLRRVNPEAYTPQMLLIGPLHHSKKAQALELSKTDLRYLDYMNMELQKKKYLNGVANLYGYQIIQAFRGIIQRDEQIIRESYAESTDWIKSQEFVEMILHDSVFILVFFLQTGTQNFNKKGDILFEEPCLITTILEDLILLENQLPYAILEELFEPFLFYLKIEKTFREIVLGVFKFERKIEKEMKFRHFTDLYRRVRVETLGLTKKHITSRAAQPKSIKSLHNADELDSAGVDFTNVDKENEFSLVINFEHGILKMPCFIAEDNTERQVRNIMALEQCHYPFSAFVCNYIAFLDFLIDTEQNVDLLVKKGVIKNWLGHQGSVAEMVNKLCLGLVDFGSYYYNIAEDLNNHYNSRLNRSIATLRRVYFKDLWTGTATITAVFLLVLTLIGTVASVLQVTSDDNKSPPRGR
ncbi:hypothetical protein AALP_AA4G238200 [Arabis alpina]|uniref:Uncharacterized protein n=1 Tax=Arabis alpina TaxID=50452 RepID=A0A087H587_ARAAL|nr:hypothetical protein AALP_AA4G238200 [Arabis alpina]